MLTAARAFLAAKALPIMGGALLASTVAFGVQTWRIDGLQAKNAQLVQQLKDTKAAADLSEQLRATEQSQDRTSYADQSERCEQRVVTALDAARAIEEITNANSSPATAGRPIVPAIELRRIIGQSAQGGTAGVPARGNKPAQP